MPSARARRLILRTSLMNLNPIDVDREAAPSFSTVEFYARVARRAYDLFERRGREEGHDVEDWLEAERLVKDEMLQGSEAITS